VGPLQEEGGVTVVIKDGAHWIEMERGKKREWGEQRAREENVDNSEHGFGQ